MSRLVILVSLVALACGRKVCTIPQGSVATVSWCEASCNYHNPICPSDLCSCHDQVDKPPTRWACMGSSNVFPGGEDLFTSWCNTNCNHSPSFCPSTYCSCVDVAMLASSASDLLVSGTITPISYFPESAMSGIDRFLYINFDLPALELSPISHDGFFNSSDTLCSDSDSCGAQKFSTCPGMSVTTLMTRGWATPADLTNTSPPSFKWTWSPNSYYTLLFVDVLNEYAEGFEYFFHWGVTNIQGNNIDEGDHLTSSYLSPSNTSPLAANHYTFILFEHDSPISQTDIDATRALLGNPMHAFSSMIDTLTVNPDDIVSVNWFDALGSIGSRINFMHDPSLAAFSGFIPPCENFASAGPSCFEPSSKCLYFNS